ncbi:MAG: DUF2791 family P-loop domain-containing protein [Gemmatimonadetes bacterium]|nr:DUF2791 family P-loop domain-containing protein [Gemmatimonadota bacterium]
MIRLEDYLAFARSEYLGDFIRAGGAAVKFVVPSAGASATDVHAGLEEAAREHGYVYAQVNANDVKVHMIDKVFHAIALQVPWNDLAHSVVVRSLAGLGFRLPEDQTDLSLDIVARINDYDPNEIRLEFNRRLQQEIFRDYEMAQEFRIAMIRLCQAHVDGSASVQYARAAVVDWLSGSLRAISTLKPAGIYQKIVRHNARHMLFSLARWLTKAGRSGLVLDLDIGRLAVSRRLAEDEGFHYSRAAVLDVYEVLRQLIDATDELTSCFVLVACAPEFLNDFSRGLEVYQALKLRIWDEVHDRRRTNPLSALIRVSPSAEPWTVPA